MKEVLDREIRRILHCKRHIIAAVAVPLLSLIFMATIFGDGKIEELPAGVADYSNTPVSRQIIQAADASPITSISPKHIFSNQAQAKQAMQNMEIFGYIVIPQNFAEDLYSGAVPTVTYYNHYALLAVGGEIQSAFVKALGSISASLVAESGNMGGTTPAQVESVTLPTNALFASTYNSTLNYGTFLSYPFFFIFFQIFILTFTVYIIGTDMNREWLSSGHSSILKALAGKLAPYTAIFLLEGILANTVFLYMGEIPPGTGFLALNANSALFTITTVAMGTAIISLVPRTCIAISIASMAGALGATASGVTFPVENMYPAFEALCSILPVRHFIEAYQDILYNNAGFRYSWGNYAAMLLICMICTTATPLLKRGILKGYGKPLPYMWGTALVMLGGTVGYGILYGLMYHPNIVTEVPVAVIDKSETPLSREYIRRLNATQGIHICALCPDIPQASELMRQKKAKGIIILPDNFSPLVVQGKESFFAVYETTTSFLYYLTIQKAAASTMQEFNNTLREGNVKALPLPQQLSIATAPTFTTNGVAAYNHNGGYGSYLLPIAIIVILFQTMLMCAGILGGTRTLSPWRYTPPLAGAYFLLSLFLAGAVPYIFGLPTLADKVELFLFILLFILASGAFAGTVSMLFKDTEEVMLYVPVFSVALIFLSGTSFPMVKIPHIWQIVHYIIPTSPAITGYLKLNSMGGTLQNVVPEITILSLQLCIWGAIFTLYARKIVNLPKQK
ncbi:MAG: ABC transporter permease [Bacteroidales bacterium]|nr:ABC transporter permease [Bacteroidales bacterium]